MTPTAYACPGCGRLAVWFGAAASAVIDGRRVEYLLCFRCANEARRDPQSVADRVELRLRRPGGNA